MKRAKLTSDPDPILTAVDLAEQFRVSVATIRAWERAGKIPALRVGRSVRFRWTSVLSALETAKVPSRRKAVRR